MRLHACLLFAALSIAGCAAPQSPVPPGADANVRTGQAQRAETAPSPTASQAQAQATPVASAQPARKVRTGGTLPPQMLPEPVKLDFHCASDADCAVKDIGNCCGAYPACVNADSPTDPTGVQAQCAKLGRMSSCGFREIAGCSCRKGRCAPRDDDAQSQGQ